MMSKADTINLLKRCIPVAKKLASIGCNYVLTWEEQAILNKFKEEGLCELLYDPKIYQLAGLTLDDIVNLNFLNAMELISKLQIKSMGEEKVSNKNCWFGIASNSNDLDLT